MIPRPISWVLLPKGEPIFTENSYTVTIVDECGGELVELSQDETEIRIDPSAWKALRTLINKAIRECNKHSPTS